MVVTVRNKFKTAPSNSSFTTKVPTSFTQSSKSSDSKIRLSSELIAYIESGMLIALVASLVLWKYVPFLTESTVANMYLQIYTAFFVATESFFRAYKLINTYNDKDENIWSKTTWSRTLAFLGAFGIAIAGLLPLSFKNTATFGQLVTALGLAVFPYNLSDLFISKKCCYTDLIYNGIYGVLLVSGLLSWYFGFNYIGIFTLVAVALKGVQTYRGTKGAGKSVTGNQLWLVMGFASLSVAMMVFCYYKKLTMGMPNFGDLFTRIQTHLS